MLLVKHRNSFFHLNLVWMAFHLFKHDFFFVLNRSNFEINSKEINISSGKETWLFFILLLYNTFESVNE